MSKNSTFSLRLFYSYCHKDSSFKEKMEKTLALLEENEGLKQWSDRSIHPGKPITDTIKQNMEKSNIFVFLVSNDFLASDMCKKEWNDAKKLAENGNQEIIPVILKECAWKDFDDMKSLMALPQDGKPVTKFGSRDEAWQQIYEGIKKVIENLRNCFSVKKEFVDEITKTDFISQQKQDIRLSDLFIFPSLYCNLDQDPDHAVDDINQIIKKKYALIDGDDLSGKTALCIHIFLALVEEEKPVIFIDLKDMGSKKPSMKIYQKIYTEQFHGDFSLWKKQKDITVILDNLSNSPNSIEHVIFAKENFGNVVVTVSSDIYKAYWTDDLRLAGFTNIRINRLSHTKQEMLIRKWTGLSNQSAFITDGKIDQIEDKINSIIINNRIVPRYPFYVLSILQSGEGFMPNDLKITAYGHCYYTMILTCLWRSGITKEDSDIDSCIKFASHLAFHIYNKYHKEGNNVSSVGEEEFKKFTKDYRANFVIKNTTINRLQDQYYGIIKNRNFRNPYMYYYFLGKYLSDNSQERDSKKIIKAMAEKSYVTTNRLALIFLIHHSHDSKILNEILRRTTRSLKDRKPAILNRKETKIFEDLVKAIPQDITSENSVEKERQKERERRDLVDKGDNHDAEKKENIHREMNDIYRILKNNEILGQILRNKYGSLEKARIKNIIETIADGGLRIINCFLIDQEQINGFAQFIHEKNPEIGIEKIRIEVQALIFLLTVLSIKSIAFAVNKPEIRELVEEVVHNKSTPAYDLVGYFAFLESIESFDKKENEYLGKILATHKKNDVITRIISLMTQGYMNTHKVKDPIAQSVSSKLRIKYRRRLPR